jgi:hypothetical protein
MNGAFSAGCGTACNYLPIEAVERIGNAMKTTLAALLTAAAFLSAGAFASIEKRHAARAEGTVNVTVIVKSSNWPVKGQITTEACRYNSCTDA